MDIVNLNYRGISKANWEQVKKLKAFLYTKDIKKPTDEVLNEVVQLGVQRYYTILAGMKENGEAS